MIFLGDPGVDMRSELRSDTVVRELRSVTLRDARSFAARILLISIKASLPINADDLVGSSHVDVPVCLCQK